MRTAEHTLERPILSEDVVSFTDCRGRLAEYFDKTRTTHRPIVVTQNGRATTVIMNLADWEQAFAAWEETKLTREVLNDFEISMEQFKRGEGIPFEQFVTETRKKYGL
ncbi:MAG: type II toxin-antitoxin system Phd/YefM family antitoxin [bacterium]|nr:type II toxin-antitoxin system Phd/YefM family antitoxin [bacterium]